MIRARNVSFAFGRTEILRGIDLDVAAGEIVALVGPSGSGKSTLLYCLAGVLAGWSGDISVADQELKGQSSAALCRLRAEECGYVLQFGRLIPELTARENVSLPLRLLRVRSRIANELATAKMDRLGVAHLADARSGELSGGEQQRVAIARAIIHEPKVVFADEPTGALDSTNSERVMSLLVEQARENKAAVLLVTHEDGVAARADRIVEMKDGRLRAGVS